MKCLLCNQKIKEYNPEFNQLKLSQTNSVDICHDCTQKFTRWQQDIFAKLYPTTYAKKWAKKIKKK